MKIKNGNILKQFEIARNANASLVAIQTTDAAATIKSLVTVYASSPVAQWDIINGANALTRGATEAVKIMNTLSDGSVNPSLATGNPVEMLMKIKALPGESIMCMHNAHMFIDKMMPGNLAAPVIQAVWNVRDLFRKLKSTLVMLCPSFTIPLEMQHDVLVLDEPLPYGEDHQNIIKRSFSRANLPAPGKALMPNIVDATSGLAPFAIDQVIRMSVTVTRSGNRKVDIEELWRRKIQKIEGTAGLTIHRTGPRFKDIGGNENIKAYLSRIAASPNCPLLVVFLDEIEKSLMAAGTDTSGVTSDQQRGLLTSMQDNGWDGIIFYGIPGTGKSLLAKAFGHECDAVTVEADLGGMKDKWVGSSEARMRSFLKIIKAMGGSRVFFVATCNHVEILRPELKRRFKHGIWFSDLPVKEEKNNIWTIHRRKYGIPIDQPRPDDEGWTGAEIENCCEKAAALNISLFESCRYMTIVSQAMGPELEKMRLAASNKYVSTHNPGVYVYKPKEVQ